MQQGKALADFAECFLFQQGYPQLVLSNQPLLEEQVEFEFVKAGKGYTVTSVK